MSSHIISSPREHSWKLLMFSVLQIECFPCLPELMSGSHFRTPDESDEEGNMIEENDIIDGFNQEGSSSKTDEFHEEYL